MKTAIYARVSTIDQHTDNQIIVLQKYCDARNYHIEYTYVDKGVSGSKESRPEFDNMMNDAKKRKFDCLLVWKLDRLSRSLRHLLNTLDELNNVGISFICYQDNIDTTTPTGRLMFHMVGAFAEFERSLIQERVKLGLQRAKQQGKVLGRPKIDINPYKIQQLRTQGHTIRAIAIELNLSVGAVHKTLAKK